MKFNKILIFIYAVIIIPISGCQSANNIKDTSSEKAAQLLGTVITGKAYGSNSKKALDLAFDRVLEIDNKMSRHKENSEVDLINQNAGIKPVPISPDTYMVIETAINYANITNGAFNPLLGEIIELWGIGTKDAKIPDKDTLNNFLTNIDYNNIILDKESSTAYLTTKDVKLDLGAIAKGYAADEMVRILKEEKIDSALLNLGGNVIVIGDKPTGEPWNVGIQNPLDDERGQIVGIIKLSDTSAVTSGSYERFFEVNGIRYHHILDPANGYPANSGIISSTIITPNSMDADALSTSVYVMGMDKSLELIESLENTEAILINDKNEIFTTSGIDNSIFNIKSEDFIYEKNR